MPRILYGVAGEGSGHSSRAKEVITHMEKKGHIVKVVSYDKGYKNLAPHFDVTKIFGLHFAYKDNKVQYLPTFIKNISKMPEATKSIDKINNITDKFKPDIIFTDFEPISGIVANIKKIPLISIDNQHRLTNTTVDYPKKYAADAIAAKAVVRMMVFNTKACLVTNFAKTNILNKKTFLFPPILRQEVLHAKTSNRGYIIVYFTSEFRELLDVLAGINKRFIVYGFNKNKKIGNLTLKKASRTVFLKDLASSEGVIANSGFTLITESLYLRKPYLALPVEGQFEQVLNAYQLERAGYGKYWDDLNKEKIESFLFNIDLYKKNLNKYKKEDNTKILKKIDELIKKYAKG